MELNNMPLNNQNVDEEIIIKNTLLDKKGLLYDPWYNEGFNKRKEINWKKWK